MSEELKPCPFCGNPITIDEGQIGGWVMQHHATDEECPLATDLDGGTAPIQLIYSNKKSLINVINTRPVEDELRAELARRDEIIKRLKENGERLAARPYPFIDVEHVESGTYCHYCHKSNKFAHTPDCPITLHRTLMKELEC